MLLFNLGVVVSIELSVACNIHIGENERGDSDVSTVHALFFSMFRPTVEPNELKYCEGLILGCRWF